MTQRAELTFDPMLPTAAVWLIALGLALATLVIYSRLADTLRAGQKLSLLILRLCGLALVVALLLQPSRRETIIPPQIDRVTVVAIDDSRSMLQRDTEQGTRSDAARALLQDAEIIKSDAPATPDLRLFRFSNDAVPLQRLSDLNAAGETTRMHTSVTSILGGLAANQAARALILLTDGHDFELVNPTRTGFNSRARQTPIYAVALGRQGKVRDVSARMANWQPYTYVKQKARISANLRLIGCELEPLLVELKRSGVSVQRKNLSPTDAPEVTVTFDVSEDKVGQVEYEVSVAPVDHEVDTDNNHAITYLNVVDQQIQVLFLEGAPYWDTTFLQRSFMRNEKMNVDSIVQYATGKARLIRKKSGQRELRVPQTDTEWAAYDVVVLGRSIDKLLGRDSLNQLTTYAREGGGTVIFSRGRAFEGELGENELEPVIWSEEATRHVRLQPAREGQALAPFRAISDPQAEGLPELIAGRTTTDRKTLAATLAEAHAAQGDPLPGIVHRRFGSGQVLSVGVEGLWRWAFNSRVEGPNTVFDRFWDQMTLWLMAGRDFVPAQQYALRASTAIVPLGEKIHLRAMIREPKPGLSQVPVVIRRGTEEAARTALVPEAGAADKLAVEFVPSKAGKYEATARFPDGTDQTVRFMVIDENVEQTEVATDSGFLKQLCESSGGRMLKPEELGPLVAGLQSAKSDASPQTRQVPIWDRTSVFWLIGALFGLEWYLRRRWGLT